MTTQFNFDKRPPLGKMILALLLILLLAVVLLSCEFTKKLIRSKSDSASVHKNEVNLIDTSKSGQVSKSSSNMQENWDWWKQTIIPGTRRDTNIYNFYNQPAGQAQQPVIIYEGGKGSRETNTQQTDSFWRNMALQLLAKQSDSTHVKEDTKQLEKETETGSKRLAKLAGL